jgi:hypothetical protein
MVVVVFWSLMASFWTTEVAKQNEMHMGNYVSRVSNKLGDEKAGFTGCAVTSL